MRSGEPFLLSWKYALQHLEQRTKKGGKNGASRGNFSLSSLWIILNDLVLLQQTWVWGLSGLVFGPWTWLMAESHSFLLSCYRRSLGLIGFGPLRQTSEAFGLGPLLAEKMGLYTSYIWDTRSGFWCRKLEIVQVEGCQFIHYWEDKLTPFVLRHGEIVYILICTSLLRLVTISCRHKCPMNFDPRPHSPPTTSRCIELGNNSLTKMLNQLDVSLQPIFYFLFSLF